MDIAREKTLIVVTPSGDSGIGRLAAMTVAFQRERIDREVEGIEAERSAAMREVAREEALIKG